MNAQPSFKLILRSKEFQIPSNVKYLRKIPDDIRNSLFFNPNNQYYVQSNVSEEVFQSFVDYWINNTLPDIRKDNISEYLQISQEFNLLKELIDSKMELWGEYLIHLNGLNERNNKELSLHEEQITKNLDYYLENYGEQVMNKPIQSLFNIFNHKQRNLTKFNIAYELIKIQSRKSNNSEVFILLPSLDGTKLNEKYLKESISLVQERQGFMPMIESSFVTDAIKKQENHEERIKELETKIQDYEDKFEKEIDRITKILDKHGDDISTNDEKKSNEIAKLNEIIENQLKEIETMKDEYKNEVSSLKEIIENQNNEILTLKEVHNNEIVSLNESIKNHQNKITSIIKSILSENQENSNQLNFDNVDHFLLSNLSYKDPGILQQLKNEEKSWRDPLFITSQSSGDVYHLIDPDTNDICSLNSKDFFIEFEIPESITIIGFKVFSSSSYYPKSFDIEIEGKIVKSIKEAKELNGKHREMNIDIEPMKGRIIRIINKGKNWDKDKYSMNLQRIEILSSEAKYSKGVFATLIESNSKRDPHKCGVHITSTNFGFNSFHMIDAAANISTDNQENSWFQVELTKGTAIISGFRLKKGNSCKLKNFKIVGTDDINKPIDRWSTLIEINEKTENDHKQLDIYNLPKPSPPIKFIRLIQTGKGWNNDEFLIFYHLDFFGYYF